MTFELQKLQLKSSIFTLYIMHIVPVMASQKTIWVT